MAEISNKRPFLKVEVMGAYWRGACLRIYGIGKTSDESVQGDVTVLFTKPNK